VKPFEKFVGNMNPVVKRAGARIIAGIIKLWAYASKEASDPSHKTH
jgi:hypothetical protein